MVTTRSRAGSVAPPEAMVCACCLGLEYGGSGCAHTRYLFREVPQSIVPDLREQLGEEEFANRLPPFFHFINRAPPPPEEPATGYTHFVIDVTRPLSADFTPGSRTHDFKQFLIAHLRSEYVIDSDEPIKEVYLASVHNPRLITPSFRRGSPRVGAFTVWDFRFLVEVSTRAARQLSEDIKRPTMLDSLVYPDPREKSFITYALVHYIPKAMKSSRMLRTRAFDQRNALAVALAGANRFDWAVEGAAAQASTSSAVAAVRPNVSTSKKRARDLSEEPASLPDRPSKRVQPEEQGTADATSKGKQRAISPIPEDDEDMYEEASDIASDDGFERPRSVHEVSDSDSDADDDEPQFMGSFSPTTTKVGQTPTTSPVAPTAVPSSFARTAAVPASRQASNDRPVSGTAAAASPNTSAPTVVYTHSAINKATSATLNNETLASRQDTPTISTEHATTTAFANNPASRDEPPGPSLAVIPPTPEHPGTSVQRAASATSTNSSAVHQSSHAAASTIQASVLTNVTLNASLQVPTDRMAPPPVRPQLAHTNAPEATRHESTPQPAAASDSGRGISHPGDSPTSSSEFGGTSHPALSPPFVAGVEPRGATHPAGSPPFAGAIEPGRASHPATSPPFVAGVEPDRQTNPALSPVGDQRAGSQVGLAPAGHIVVQANPRPGDVHAVRPFDQQAFGGLAVLAQVSELHASRVAVMNQAPQSDAARHVPPSAPTRQVDAPMELDAGPPPAQAQAYAPYHQQAAHPPNQASQHQRSTAQPAVNQQTYHTNAYQSHGYHTAANAQAATSQVPPLIQMQQGGQPVTLTPVYPQYQQPEQLQHVEYQQQYQSAQNDARVQYQQTQYGQAAPSQQTQYAQAAPSQQTQYVQPAQYQYPHYEQNQYQPNQYQQNQYQQGQYHQAAVHQANHHQQGMQNQDGYQPHAQNQHGQYQPLFQDQRNEHQHPTQHQPSAIPNQNPSYPQSQTQEHHHQHYHAVHQSAPSYQPSQPLPQNQPRPEVGPSAAPQLASNTAQVDRGMQAPQGGPAQLQPVVTQPSITQTQIPAAQGSQAFSSGSGTATTNGIIRPLRLPRWVRPPGYPMTPQMQAHPRPEDVVSPSFAQLSLGRAGESSRNGPAAEAGPSGGTTANQTHPSFVVPSTPQARAADAAGHVTGPSVSSSANAVNPLAGHVTEPPAPDPISAITPPAVVHAVGQAQHGSGSGVGVTHSANSGPPTPAVTEHPAEQRQAVPGPSHVPQASTNPSAAASSSPTRQLRVAFSLSMPGVWTNQTQAAHQPTVQAAHQAQAIATATGNANGNNIFVIFANPPAQPPVGPTVQVPQVQPAGAQQPVGASPPTAAPQANGTAQVNGPAPTNIAAQGTGASQVNVAPQTNSAPHGTGASQAGGAPQAAANANVGAAPQPQPSVPHVPQGGQQAAAGPSVPRAAANFPPPVWQGAGRNTAHAIPEGHPGGLRWWARDWFFDGEGPNQG